MENFSRKLVITFHYAMCEINPTLINKLILQLSLLLITKNEARSALRNKRDFF